MSASSAGRQSAFRRPLNGDMLTLLGSYPMNAWVSCAWTAAACAPAPAAVVVARLVGAKVAQGGGGHFHHKCGSISQAIQSGSMRGRRVLTMTCMSGVMFLAAARSLTLLMIWSLYARLVRTK